MYPRGVPPGVLILIMPDRPDGLLAEPQARVNSPLAVSSRSVLSARLEAGPWILGGEVALSEAAIKVEAVSEVSGNACRHAPWP